MAEHAHGHEHMKEISEANQQLSVSLAALILHQIGKDITAETITTILHHSGIKVEGFWPVVMAKALSKANVEDLIMNTAAAPVAAAPAAAGAAAEEKKEENKEEKKEEKKDEPEEDFGGFGDLF
ncbi:60S acidic ribosomal protein P1, putative [Entamoeba invadens IP1]|uniref:60S acidic ribosomal protein P1, putative n=1 Tax=Entamoeba invadens IP1 TaxID=370355 RepID=A0A0A1U4I2_ENTIV|nr:60S acidic ribosomal protein P1, putative [Entamoeba invadens IP1]ELP89161.1 60S acidic ribosomal protein P1, putative [Entamoeba invadens IP1]|eukprot:XP_004255932.1 60S acidic ribosomal protein P1, putative [Entamoeba invadens IP1]